MPETYEFKHAPHDVIRDQLRSLTDPEDAESPAILLAARHKRVGNVLALMGIVIEEDSSGKKANVKLLTVARRASGHRIGREILEQGIEWAESQEAMLVQIDAPPPAESPAAKFLHDRGFEKSSFNKPVLKLTDEANLDDATSD